MPTHIFKKNPRDNFKVVKNQRCLDSYKGYRFLGTLVKSEIYEKYEELIEWVRDEFKKFGFKTYIVKHKSGIGIYADRKDHPTVASFMVSVSIGRYMYSSSDLVNVFKMFKLLREQGWTFCRSVVHSSGYTHTKNISLAYHYTGDIIRSRPLRSSTRRQAGSSIFQKHGKSMSQYDYQQLQDEQAKFYDLLRSIRNKKFKPTEQQLKQINSFYD